MSAPLLRIEHLEVRYGDLIGVSDVSLEVPEGSVVALLGSNGGGKTTTLNAIAGLIPVHAGIDQLSRRGDRRPGRVFDRAQGAGAVAGRLAAVRAAERREQSDARRDAAARQGAHRRAARARLRDLSEAGRAAQPARRHHVRRRAADAGGRPRADERSQAPDAGRAVARAWRRPWSSRCTRRSGGCTRKG